MTVPALITEKEIRPPHFADAIALRVEEDLAYLIARRDRFVAVCCPACGAEGKPAFDKKGIEYAACGSCRTVFVNPRPSPELLHEFYAQSSVYAFWNEHIFPASEDARRKKIFAPRVRRLLDMCQQYGVQPETLLEIGAGFGTFCEELRSTGQVKTVLAVEPTPDLAETCRRRGLTVFECPVERLELPDASVDVIASFETIEHLYSPMEFVSSCRRFLKPGGLLVLSCPNFFGFDILTLREASDSIDHEHLNYFNPQSIVHLLARCGYGQVDVQTPGEIDVDIVRNKIGSGVVDLSQMQPFLHHLLIDRWEDAGPAFQQFLVQNCLSSHMLVAARV